MAPPASKPPGADFPFCASCLALTALVFHSLALAGNLRIGSSIGLMGHSSAGWSDVGIGLAESLTTQLDARMQETTQGMTDAIEALTLVKARMADVLSQVDSLRPPTAPASLPEGARGTPTSSMLSVHSGNISDVLSSSISVNASEVIRNLASLIVKELSRFHKSLQPVLQQIKKWLVTFGEKMQATVAGFTSAIDLAQKLFDQIMAHLQSAGGNEDRMVAETYSLFDVDNQGKISLQDIHDLADLFSISALQGTKADALFAKYDATGSGGINVAEFTMFVNDDTIPGVMAVVLRSYARKLTDIAGHISRVRMRDEVAKAVAEYITLVSAKDTRKISWLADALTNNSLPLAFTADTLAQLALNSDNPDKLTTADVGAFLVGEMVRLAPQHVAKAVELLANASSWESEGFDPGLQSSTVAQVTKWVSEADHAKKILPLLVSVFQLPQRTHADQAKQAKKPRDDREQDDAEEGALLQVVRREKHPDCSVQPTAVEQDEDVGEDSEDSALLQDLGEDSEDSALLQKHPASVFSASRLELSKSKTEHQQDLPKAAVSFCEYSLKQQRQRTRSDRTQRRYGFHSTEHTLIDSSGRWSGADADVLQAVNSGVHALPETLQFAKWLSQNASNTANRLQGEAFDYTSQSSGAMDSVAQKVSRMTKRFTNLLNMLQKWATPQNIDRLDQFATNVISHLEEDIVSGLDPDRGLNATIDNVTRGLAKISKIWEKADPFLDKLQTILPTAIDDVKQARAQVASTAATLNSMFQVFRVKGPPIFHNISSLYSTIWIVYFAVFALLTIALLAYAFWASGFFGGYFGGGDSATSRMDENYAAPSTLASRCSACLTSCCSCLRHCEDTQLFFWSVILFMEALWLAMFITSFVTLTLMGVKAFIVAGCSPVYILTDNNLCTEALGFVADWLEHPTWMQGASIGDACSTKQLLICKHMRDSLSSAMLSAAVGNSIAAIVTFLLIVETGIMHERHRCRLLFEGKGADERDGS